MRLLLDTHAFLWWLDDAPTLSKAARKAISSAGNTVMVSAASAWEIATKYRLGRLQLPAGVAEDMAAYLIAEGFVGLPVTIRHGHHAGALPGHHHDPFDRMLIAQAIVDDLELVSNESIFDAYGVRRLW